MPPSDRTLILDTEIRGDQVRRKFTDQLKGTIFWSALSQTEGKFQSTGLTAANVYDLCTTFRDVPSYIDILIIHVNQCSHNEPHTIIVKACDDHLFVELYGPCSIAPLDASQWPILRPFFDPRPSGQNGDKGGVADTILLLAPSLVELDLPENEWSRLFAWFSLKINIRKHEDNGKMIVEPVLDWTTNEFRRSQFSLRYYPWASNGVCRKWKTLCVASPTFRKALGKLAEAWHDDDLRSVLLCAPPGAGKEVLKEFLWYALRLTRSDGIEFSAPELHSRGNIVSNILVHAGKSGIIQAGETRRTFVFFDEIHQPSAARVREALLRIMESGELRGAGGRVRVAPWIFVFAGSRRWSDLRTEAPPDFWTRIEYPIELEHPLQIRDKRQRKDALREYVRMFWSDGQTIETEANEASIEAEDVREWLAEGFADEMASPFLPAFSIRTLRSIVKRLKSRARYGVRRGTAPRDRAGWHGWLEDELVGACAGLVPEVGDAGRGGGW